MSPQPPPDLESGCSSVDSEVSPTTLNRDPPPAAVTGPAVSSDEAARSSPQRQQGQLGHVTHGTCCGCFLPSGDDDEVLAGCEGEQYTYTCHEASAKRPEIDRRIKRAKIKATAWFGLRRGLRLTPPMYRKHKDIAKDKLSGSLYKILANECMEQLYDDNTDGNFGEIGFLSFSRLHHMNLHYFEVELAAELANIVSKGDTNRRQMLRVRKKLREYSQAVSDYSNVLQHWKQPPAKKLTAFHETILPEAFRDHIGKEVGTWDNAYIPLPSTNPWGTALASRIGAALLGGILLIVPVAIMAAGGDTSTKNLVTTSVAVVLVAVGLASTSLGTWQDVLGITAAYAAVLVVFVGTSTGPAALPVAAGP